MSKQKPTVHTLSGGMQVVLEENHAAPVVALNILAKVGSADEADHEAGISHFIEHMVFKGTPSRPVGVISREVEAAGGEMNAYTSFDQTVYYINMASRFQEKGIEVLADMLQHPLFDAEELARETEVIVEEIRRGRDSPQHYLGEMIFEKAYQTHPYRRPIIGYEKTVRAIDQKKIRGYFQRWYHPGNMVFIAVGDFQTDSMLKKLDSFFHKGTGLFAVPKVRTAETVQTKLRHHLEKDNIQSSYFGWAFHIPEITHPEVPAIDILAHVLAGADSARLERILKEEKRLVQNIYAAAYTPKDPGLFMIGGHLNEQNLNKTFSVIQEEMARLQNEPISSAELANAKRNIVASEIYEKETVGGVGGKLAYFLATTGMLDFEEKYYRQIKEVTAHEVQEAARKYLHTEGLTSVTLTPKSFHKGVAFKPKEHAVKVKKSAAEIQKWTLANGIRLIVEGNHNLPLVSVVSASMGGLLLEKPSNNGINTLLSHTWTKGTKKRNHLQLVHATEKMAGQLEAYSGRNAMGLKTEFLSEHLQDGLELFAEVLMEPSFDATEVKKEKVLQIEAIKNQEDVLSSIAFLNFQKNLFPNHPYGLRLLGERNSVSKLAFQHLNDYYRKIVGGKNLVISVVGDCAPQEVYEFLAERLKKIPARSLGLSLPRPSKKPNTTKTTQQKKEEKQQAHIVLGFQATTIKSRDRFAFMVLTNLLSGMGGRLFLELRDKLSLAYSVTATLQEGVQPGYFAVYIGTEPSKVPTAVEGIKRELRKVCEKPVGAAELGQTKQYLVGTYELDLQKCMSRANQYALNELYGLGIEEIRRYPERFMKVTAADVLQVAQKYIDLDRYVLSIVEP